MTVNPIIKNIIFDIDGVITTHLHDPEWSDKQLAEEYNVPLDTIRDLFKEWIKKAGPEGIGLEDFWQQKTVDMGPIPLDAMREATERHERDIIVDARMIKILTILKKQRIRLFALTNTWKPGHKHREELEPYFEAFVQSCDIGASKPDPAAYQFITAHYNISPQQTLFVDNFEDNVNAAKKTGMHAIKFTNPVSLTQTLTDLEVLT